ncbi:MAG: hypothetical protein FWF44_10820, partial [Defluviitaleaceae bacterium]|nr:hypothetical protein [Defluviitaleaceae bacterium]
MGAITPNFNLFKPDFPDPANIVVAVANNMDILDGELGKIKEAIDGFSPDQNAALPADLLSAFGNVMQILSWYSALFKAVTGEADWFDPPAVPLNEKVTGIWTIYDRYTLEAAYNLTENETLDQIADLVPDYSIVVIHLANNSWMNLPP